MPPTRRRIQLNGVQKAVGQPFSVTFQAPATEQWRIRHLSVSVPNYASGLIPATVTLDGVFLFGTSQGQQDSADGDGAPDVGPGQSLTVTWSPTRGVGVVSGLVQGVAVLVVDQAH